MGNLCNKKKQISNYDQTNKTTNSEIIKSTPEFIKQMKTNDHLSLENNPISQNENINNIKFNCSPHQLEKILNKKNLSMLPFIHKSIMEHRDIISNSQYIHKEMIPPESKYFLFMCFMFNLSFAYIHLKCNFKNLSIYYLF
jgi:hypothetical protein